MSNLKKSISELQKIGTRQVKERVMCAGFQHTLNVHSLLYGDFDLPKKEDDFLYYAVGKTFAFKEPHGLRSLNGKSPIVLRSLENIPYVAQVEYGRLTLCVPSTEALLAFMVVEIHDIRNYDQSIIDALVSRADLEEAHQIYATITNKHIEYDDFCNLFDIYDDWFGDQDESPTAVGITTEDEETDDEEFYNNNAKQ